ncbi:MAG: alpha/beta fold hydrolase [Planctomycetota bacterium]
MSPAVVDPDDSIVVTDVGVSLTTTVYRPDVSPSVAIVMSSGTGFGRSFYRRLAEFFCDKGAAVVTYDYRAIGDSSSPELLQETDIPDWGRDLDAVLSWTRGAFSGSRVVHVGHSAGGHIVAFSKRAREIEKHLFVAVGSGTLWQHFVSRWPMEIYFWWILGPISLALRGHIAKIGGWTGTPLPAPAFRTWRRWSHRGRYYEKDVLEWNRQHSIGPVSEIQSWVFTDDGICTPRTAQTILDCFPGALKSMEVVAPAEVGLERIGHEGVFRKKSPVWDRMWASIEDRDGVRAPG